MPAVHHKKKQTADESKVEDRRKVVSAYSEEGRERNLRDSNHAKRFRIIALTVSIVLFIGTIVGAILILHFATR